MTEAEYGEPPEVIRAILRGVNSAMRSRFAEMYSPASDLSREDKKFFLSGSGRVPSLHVSGGGPLFIQAAVHTDAPTTHLGSIRLFFQPPASGGRTDMFKQATVDLYVPWRGEPVTARSARLYIPGMVEAIGVWAAEGLVSLWLGRDGADIRNLAKSSTMEELGLPKISRTPLVGC